MVDMRNQYRIRVSQPTTELGQGQDIRQADPGGSITAFDTSAAVCLRSSLSTFACRNLVPTFPQRSPPSLLTTAACSGLRPEPDCRPQRTYLHLSYSYASPFGPAMPRDTRPEPVFGGPILL